jgi:ABC-type polysaccharide/polyol phosphate export permease
MSNLSKKMSSLFWMTICDFKLRDQGTLLGFAWTLLNPVCMFIALYLVFNSWFGKLVPNYPVYLMVGILHWNFFALATSNSVTIFDRKRNLLKSFRLGAFTIPTAAVLTVFISYLFEAVIVLFLCMFTLGLTLSSLFWFVVMLLINLVFTLGISLLLANMYIFIRDISHLWSIAIRIGFFITPVFYPLNFVDPSKLFFLQLNPLYHIMNFSRSALLEGNIQLDINFMYLILISFFLLAVSAKLYKQNQHKLVERL